MTEQEKQLWLEAIGKLRKRYERYELDQIPPSYAGKYYLDCPLCEVVKSLCEVVKSFYNLKYTCTPCLWVKFEDRNCIVNHYDRDLTFQRLDRLDRWERLIKEMK